MVDESPLPNPKILYNPLIDSKLNLRLIKKNL